MKTKLFFFAITLLAFLGHSMAQSHDPNRRSAFALKVVYDMPDYNVQQNIQSDLNYGKAIGITRHASAGFSLRIPVWRFVYVQPEALYSFSSDWDSCLNESGYFRQLTTAFKDRSASFLDIPIYAGVRWVPLDILALRLYAGPIFNFAIDGKRLERDKDSFNIAAGLGVDVLNLVFVDAGYRRGMKGKEMIEDSDMWFVAVSLRL